MIDSHAHLTDNRFDADRAEAIRRARDVGVAVIVCPGTDVASSRRALELAHEFETVLAAVGIDRDGAAAANAAALAEVERLATDEQCVAIGEIGLDYHYDRVPRDVQRQVFEAQLEVARRLGLPVIVHCRNAFDDCLAILKRAGVSGVMHCFSGDASTATRCCDLGLMVSFAGTLSFPKAEALRAAARAVPTEHLIIETDSPYLAPQPVRGRRNEPAYLVHIAQTLAEVLGLTQEDVERITSVNARLLFGLPVQEEAAIVYRIRNSLYVNITNRCTNRCVFCPRSTNPRVKGHWLGLAKDAEPDASRIIASIGDPMKYDEVVFCGFGEPTLRLDVVLDVARWVKAHGGRTRLNTNGHGDRIAGRPIAPLLDGLIDSVSVSVNTADPAQYPELCRPESNGGAFQTVLAFIRAAKEHVPEVVVTALDYPGVDVDAVERLAAELGVTFRLRAYKHLG